MHRLPSPPHVAQLRGAARGIGSGGSVPGPALSQTSARGIPRSVDDKASHASLQSRLSGVGGSALRTAADGNDEEPPRSLDIVVDEAVSEALGGGGGASIPAQDRLEGILDLPALDAARVCACLEARAGSIAASCLGVGAPPGGLGAIVACLARVLVSGAATHAPLCHAAANALAAIGLRTRARDEDAADTVSVHRLESATRNTRVKFHVAVALGLGEKRPRVPNTAPFT